MTDLRELREYLAEQSHIGWMEEKQRQGFADHGYQPGGKADDGSRRCLRCYGPEDRHHTDMLPYDELPENIKDYDRKTVDGVLEGIIQAGYALIRMDDYADHSWGHLTTDDPPRCLICPRSKEQHLGDVRVGVNVREEFRASQQS